MEGKGEEGGGRRGEGTGAHGGPLERAVRAGEVGLRRRQGQEEDRACCRHPMKLTSQLRLRCDWRLATGHWTLGIVG